MKTASQLTLAVEKAEEIGAEARGIEETAALLPRSNADGPYRQFDVSERLKYQIGYMKSVQVMRMGAWRWGPFAGGTVKWGDETYRVWATPWFSFWWRVAKSGKED